MQTIFLPIVEENPSTKFFIFNWTGGLSHTTRTTAEVELLIAINTLRNIYPKSKITYFGHSHGGTIACESTYLCQEIIKHTDHYFNFLNFLKNSFSNLESLIKSKDSLNKNINKKIEYDSESFSQSIIKFKNNYFNSFNNSITHYFKEINALLKKLINKKNKEKLKIKKKLYKTISQALELEKLLNYKHRIFLDTLVCIRRPMPASSHQYIASKNNINKYLNKTIISLSSPNDTVIDHYIGFPLYTSNKF